MSLSFLQWRSIQTRVTLLTLAVFLAGIWSLAWYASRVLQQDLQRVLSEQQYSTVSILAADVNQAFDERLRGLSRVATAASPLFDSGRAALQALLNQRPILREAFNGGVVVLAADGTVLAEVPAVIEGKRGLDLLDLDEVTAALKHGESLVTRPVMDKQRLAPVFAVAVPVRDAQGRVIGVVCGVVHLGLPSFLDRITAHRYGQTGDYFLTALRHRLNVTSSDKSRIMEALPPPGVNPLIDRFVEGHEGSVSYGNQHGVDILVSVKAIPSVNWAMVATLPTEEAYAPIRALRQRILLATLVLTVLAGGMIWWVTSRLLRRQFAPMLAATRTLATLSDPGQQLPVTRRDELGELIGGFNRLLQTLAERERALQDSEAYNKVLFASSHIPLGVMDPQLGRLVDCNQAMVDIYGLPNREAVLAISPADVATPTQYDGRNSAETAFEPIAHALRKGFHVFEWRHRRPDGQVWDAEVHLMSFQHAGKTLLQFSLQDISARKRAEAELRVAATAFESQEGMIITDVEQRILRINGACSQITGYTAEEVVGRTPRVFSSGRHDAAFYRDMWAGIHATGAWKGELWNRRKNGEIYPEWFSISAVRGSDGKVTNYVASFIDISQRKTAEDEIKHLAFYDPLTRLPNRRLLLDRLRHAVVSGARSESAGALFFIDVDNFKTLNDTLGHDKGDLLLECVARRLSATVRAEDTVARLGGDEFVLMMEGLSLSSGDAAAQARHVAEKILGAFSEPFDLAGLAYHCSASIGIAFFTGETDTVEDLLRRADLAMYQAKAAGRNTVRFFDPEMQAVVMERAAMESELREALRKQQLLLHYQPQVDDAGRLIGAEALVRWQHPRRGLVGPLEFIALAEETALILPLGHWVLESACMQLVNWASQPTMAHLTVAVNVSAHQLRQRDFVEQVSSVLRSTGANPKRLKLELTESLLVSNVEEVIDKMSALKAQGVGFSLDDFGTGYSSLSYLRRLPLDQLKIDQSFVRDVLDDPNDATIAKTIVALAHSLGLDVIAEGVETEAQRAFLVRSGCRAYQGYLFSRPLPIDAFDGFARQR